MFLALPASSILVNGWISGVPSPGISGIMNLAGNREVIYGAQQLAGKILSRKELAPFVHEVLRVAQDLGGGLVRPPNASTFALASLGSLDCEPQGLGSHRRVIAQRVSENGDTSHLSLVVPSLVFPEVSHYRGVATVHLQFTLIHPRSIVRISDPMRLCARRGIKTPVESVPGWSSLVKKMEAI